MVFEAYVPALKAFLEKFTYAAVPAIGFLSSSTIFLPLPFDAIIFVSTPLLGLNPFLVGILAGIGAGLGESTGYFAGYGGRKVFTKLFRKKPRKRKKEIVSESFQREVERFKKILVESFISVMKKHLFFFIILACFIPFAFDFIGIVSGSLRYDFKKFLLAATIGKSVRYLLLAYVPLASISLLTQG